MSQTDVNAITATHINNAAAMLQSANQTAQAVSQYSPFTHIYTDYQHKLKELEKELNEPNEEHSEVNHIYSEHQRKLNKLNKELNELKNERNQLVYTGNSGDNLDNNNGYAEAAAVLGGLTNVNPNDDVSQKKFHQKFNNPTYFRDGLSVLNNSEHERFDDMWTPRHVKSNGNNLYMDVDPTSHNTNPLVRASDRKRDAFGRTYAKAAKATEVFDPKYYNVLYNSHKDNPTDFYGFANFNIPFTEDNDGFANFNIEDNDGMTDKLSVDDMGNELYMFGNGKGEGMDMETFNNVWTEQSRQHKIVKARRRGSCRKHGSMTSQLKKYCK